MALGRLISPFGQDRADETNDRAAHVARQYRIAPSKEERGVNPYTVEGGNSEGLWRLTAGINAAGISR